MTEHGKRADDTIDKDHTVINGFKIGFQEVLEEIRRSTGAAPLGDGEWYFKMDVSAVQGETSSYGALFWVKARSRVEAVKRAETFLLSRCLTDDAGFEIGWTAMSPYYKPEHIGPEIEIVEGPLDETAYLANRHQMWQGYLHDMSIGNNDAAARIVHRSTLSEWRWPIIFIPIIVLLMFALEYISKY